MGKIKRNFFVNEKRFLRKNFLQLRKTQFQFCEPPKREQKKTNGNNKKPAK